MSTQESNEKKFKKWKKTKSGGRLYSRQIEGQNGWFAVYFKDTDGNERTLRFWQEIYNEKAELVEIHEKFPEDKGHQIVQIMITRHAVATKIHQYLKHQLTLTDLVSWCENVLLDGDISESDIDVISEVAARIGVADVANFGLLWKECDEILRKLGYELDFDLNEVA